MSQLGQNRTSEATPIYVRFRGLSRHTMSAFFLSQIPIVRFTGVVAQRVQD